jgi:hypothetical protein
MTDRKKSGTKGGKPGTFDRRAIARILVKTRKQETEAAHEAKLIGEVLSRAARLDTQTHFDAASLTCGLYCKIKDMPGTNRQALFSDPDFARALYRHIQNAFPKEAKAAFSLYFDNLNTTAPSLLDDIQKAWDSAGQK